MTIVHLWYLVLDSVKPRMQEIGGARKTKRMIIDGIWYLSLFDRFGQVKDARTRHCICIGTIGVRARSQKGFPCTATTNSGLSRETLLEQGEMDTSFETCGIGDRGAQAGR